MRGFMHAAHVVYFRLDGTINVDVSVCLPRYECVCAHSTPRANLCIKYWTCWFMSYALSVPYMTEPKGELEPHLFLDVSFAHRFIPAVHHTCETLIPRFVWSSPLNFWNTLPGSQQLQNMHLWFGSVHAFSCFARCGGSRFKELNFRWWENHHKRSAFCKSSQFSEWPSCALPTQQFHTLVTLYQVEFVNKSSYHKSLGYKILNK